MAPREVQAGEVEVVNVKRDVTPRGASGAIAELDVDDAAFAVHVEGSAFLDRAVQGDHRRVQLVRGEELPVEGGADPCRVANALFHLRDFQPVRCRNVDRDARGL